MVWKTRGTEMLDCTESAELLTIALSTTLCGGQSAVDMALFAKAKEPFLAGLKFENGLRSHDTLRPSQTWG